MAIHDSSVTIQRPGHFGQGAWNLSGLTDITVLFGKNGSGKSQLLRALRDSDRVAYHYASPERAGEINHNVNITQEELTGANRAGRRQANLAPTYREESISRIPALLQKIGHVTGYGAPSPIDLSHIGSDLQILLPEFEFRITTETNKPYSLTRVPSGEEVSSVSALSSGEAEILAIALDILTICAMWQVERQSKRVLLLDEPDTHLHPDLQQHFGKFLVTVLKKYKAQAIIATHSTTLLAALGFHGGESTSVIYLNNRVDEQRAIPFDRTLRELSACLGGHALMGPLFSAPILLVEGDDDYRIWSQVPRFNQINIAVIPCEGAPQLKDYQVTLERMFASLRGTTDKALGYGLLDGDQAVPQASPARPQDHVRLVRLACHESENLYLTDEVLALLGTTWDQAKEKIKQDASKYGAKEQILLTCDTWDRKFVDLKDVIGEVARIIDTKNVLWTQRVAKCIGTRRPFGQLAEYLGNELVVGLWGPAPASSPEAASVDQAAVVPVAPGLGLS